MSVYKTFPIRKASAACLLLALLILADGATRLSAQEGPAETVTYLPLIYSSAGRPTAPANSSGTSTHNDEVDAALFPIQFSQPESYALISWVFLFDVENGAPQTIYRLTADIFNPTINNPTPRPVERVELDYSIVCESSGNVAYANDAVTFQEGYLRCAVGEGKFQQFITDVVKAGDKYDLRRKNIHYSPYRDPYAAASVDLLERSVANEYGVLADHPDVCLRILKEGTMAEHYPLELRVVAEGQTEQGQLSDCSERANVLEALTWEVSTGVNRFWVGQSVENFLRIWNPDHDDIWPTELLPWFAFLPSPEFFYQFISLDRFFWHQNGSGNETTDDAGPTNVILGAPTNLESPELTIGCDINGQNCVNMTLETLILDPTCMGG